MRKIILDFGATSTPEEVQQYLAMKFDFPDYYGMNLDALYDELTSTDIDTCAGVFLPETRRTIDGYLRRVGRVMLDAEEENPHFAVIFGELEENFS